MIDFIRIQYKDKSIIEPHLLNKENFPRLFIKAEKHNENVHYPHHADLLNMKISIYFRSVVVKNSLHKLSNRLKDNGNHNHNDLKYTDLSNAIDYLNNKLIDLNQADITQLEFGLNIYPNFSVPDFIRKNLLMHNYSPLNLKTYRGQGILKEIVHTNYSIKIYDKARQYELHFINILRIEIKFLNKKDFNHLGITSINDLKVKNKLEELFRYFLMKYDQLMIIDEYTNFNNGIWKYCNPNYWNRLRDRRYKNRKAKERKKFKKLLEDKNLLNTKNLIRSMLISKFKECINN